MSMIEMQNLKDKSFNIYEHMGVGTTHQHILRLQEYNLSSKRQEIINLGEDVEKREPLCIAGENVNWYSHYGKQYASSLKN